MNRKELAETLPQADRAGVFSLPAGVMPTLIEVATDCQFAIYRVSLEGCAGTGEVVDRFQETVAAPGSSGGSWEALADILTDLSWREAAGYLLLIEETADFQAAGNDNLDTLISTLSAASASWSGLGVPFWAFLVLDP